MGVHPHGCLGGTKAHRRIIIGDNAGKFKFPSQLHPKMLELHPLGMVRDFMVFVVLPHHSYYRYFYPLTTVVMWLGATKNRTFNAEKPPKEAVFLRKVVRVTGFEPAASCSQSRRATNCATPGYSVYLSGWSYSPKAGALPTALHPEIPSYYNIAQSLVSCNYFLHPSPFPRIPPESLPWNGGLWYDSEVNVWKRN